MSLAETGGKLHCVNIERRKQKNGNKEKETVLGEVLVSRVGRKHVDRQCRHVQLCGVRQPG